MRHAFFLAAALAVLFATAGNADLVAHWTGDNTAVDATGNGHDGALSGATYTTGVLGGAFAFGGDGDIVTVLADPALEPTPSISISLWVQSVPENHLRVLADSSHGPGQAGWAVQLNSSNDISFAYGNGVSFPELTANINIADGQFHHVAATLDGTTMSLYVDGVLANTAAFSGVPLPQNGQINLGHNTFLNRPLQGALDDVRIYNHALSAGEVAALFNPVPEPGTAGLAGIILFGGLIRRHRVV